MNYSRSMPFYCVSIGYLKNGKPEGGAVYIPELDELYYCEKGKRSQIENLPKLGLILGDYIYYL